MLGCLAESEKQGTLDVRDKFAKISQPHPEPPFGNYVVDGFLIKRYSVISDNRLGLNKTSDCVTESAVLIFLNINHRGGF
jgi:hypothetical protein